MIKAKCKNCGYYKKIAAKELCWTCYHKQHKGKIIVCNECKMSKKEQVKGLCQKCYNRLNQRKKYNLFKKKQQKYRKEHNSIYNKLSLKHYYANHEKRKIVLLDNKRSKVKKVKCMLCQSKENLEYHHITYDRKQSIIEVLCRKCHGKKHRIGGTQ